MNIQLKTVLRDLTGESGLGVIEAIVGGERRPEILEKLVGKNVKASREEIKEALNGDWRSEHLFELAQNYEFYKFTWEKIRETDKQIEHLLEEWQSKSGNHAKKEEYQDKYHKPRQKNDPKFDIKSYAYQMTGGVDLSQIDGVNINTILTMMTETGFKLKSSFPTAKHFVSWLGFAPNRKITGGKLLSSSTPKVKSHLSFAIRQAANSLQGSKSRLGDFYRRLAYRKGAMVAIIATARKIAVIIYKMLETGKEFSYEYLKEETEYIKKAVIRNIQKKIKALNLTKQELEFVF